MSDYPQIEKVRILFGRACDVACRDYCSVRTCISVIGSWGGIACLSGGVICTKIVELLADPHRGHWIYRARLLDIRARYAEVRRAHQGNRNGCQ